MKYKLLCEYNQSLSSEKLELSLEEFNLVFDEEIKDKKSLETKTQSIEDKINQINKKLFEIENQRNKLCANK